MRWTHFQSATQDVQKFKRPVIIPTIFNKHVSALDQSLTTRPQGRAAFFPSLKELTLILDTNNTRAAAAVALLLSPSLEQLTIRGRNGRDPKENARFVNLLVRWAKLPNLQKLSLDGPLFDTAEELEECLQVIKYSAAPSLRSLVIPREVNPNYLCGLDGLQNLRTLPPDIPTKPYAVLPSHSLQRLQRIDTDIVTVCQLLHLNSSSGFTSITARINAQDSDSVNEIKILIKKIPDDCARSLEFLSFVWPEGKKPEKEEQARRPIDISCLSRCTNISRFAIAGSSRERVDAQSLKRVLRSWSRLRVLDICGNAVLSPNDLASLLHSCSPTLTTLKAVVDLRAPSTEPFPMLSLKVLGLHTPPIPVDTSSTTQAKESRKRETQELRAAFRAIARAVGFRDSDEPGWRVIGNDDKH